MSLGVSVSAWPAPHPSSVRTVSPFFLVSASPTLPALAWWLPLSPPPPGPLSPWSPLSPSRPPLSTLLIAVLLVSPHLTSQSFSQDILSRPQTPGPGHPRSAGQGHHSLRFHDLQPGRGLDQWQGPGLKGQHTDRESREELFQGRAEPRAPRVGPWSWTGRRVEAPGGPQGGSCPSTHFIQNSRRI